ncbi:hypothetical protein Dip510_001017 [Elusimicrobium posterum]|uniref:hypothetical protein n=1 Tax=Elusimicrobium posterum TaxID=3116653 RepID=UPI003C78F3E0
MKKIISSLITISLLAQYMPVYAQARAQEPRHAGFSVISSAPKSSNVTTPQMVDWEAYQKSISAANRESEKRFKESLKADIVQHPVSLKVVINNGVEPIKIEKRRLTEDGFYKSEASAWKLYKETFNNYRASPYYKYSPSAIAENMRLDQEQIARKMEFNPRLKAEQRKEDIRGYVGAGLSALAFIALIAAAVYITPAGSAAIGGSAGLGEGVILTGAAASCYMSTSTYIMASGILVNIFAMVGSYYADVLYNDLSLRIVKYQVLHAPTAMAGQHLADGKFIDMYEKVAKECGSNSYQKSFDETLEDYIKRNNNVWGHDAETRSIFVTAAALKAINAYLPDLKEGEKAKDSDKWKYDRALLDLYSIQNFVSAYTLGKTTYQLPTGELLDLQFNPELEEMLKEISKYSTSPYGPGEREKILEDYNKSAYPLPGMRSIM